MDATIIVRPDRANATGQRETIWQVAVTSPPRTIIDLARFETPERVSIATDSALRDGGITERHLHARIAALRSKGRHRIPDLIRIIGGSEISRGGHSWLERRLLEIVAESGLPRPVCQQTSPRRVTVSCGSTSGFRGLHS